MAECIERKAALDAVHKWCDPCGAAVEAVLSVPAADAAPVVHGRWIEKSAPARKIYFECSHCGAQENKHTAIKGYYCWRCGAKMDGSAENG